MGATGGGSAPGTYSALEVVLLVIAILISLFVVLAIILNPVIGRLKNKRAREVLGILGEDRVVLMEPAANFFGQTSLAMRQLRGTGCLAFTADEVFFLMWLPRREFRVPIGAIRSIETPRSHLGKSTASRLLKITFVDPQGNEDSVAWLVDDLAKAKAALKRLCRSRR